MKTAIKPRRKKTPAKASAPQKLCEMQVGRSYTFQFPRHNFHGVLSPMERRRLRVESIRDLVKQPLERISFEIQPLLKRGRFIITGIDLDTGKERSFHFSSMKDISELPAEILERTVHTIYIVEEKSYASEREALMAAETMSFIKNQSYVVEEVKIPATLKRTLFKTVKPKAIRRKKAA